tara:strand:+ start:485 stop:661 length:177 start_codon:yes stop_codon:yes gene_type:complete
MEHRRVDLSKAMEEKVREAFRSSFLSGTFFLPSLFFQIDVMQELHVFPSQSNYGYVNM